MHQAAVPSWEVQSLFVYCAGLLCCLTCNFYWLLRGLAYGRELKSYRVLQSSQITGVNADASREQMHFLPDISQFCTGSFFPLFFFFAFCKRDNAHLAWRILWVPTVFTWYQQHSGWPVFIVLLESVLHLFILWSLVIFPMRQGWLYRCLKNTAMCVSQDNKVVLDCVDYWSSVLLQDG